jgi:hypothetical protein
MKSSTNPLLLRPMRSHSLPSSCSHVRRSATGSGMAAGWQVQSASPEAGIAIARSSSSGLLLRTRWPQ